MSAQVLGYAVRETFCFAIHNIPNEILVAKHSLNSAVQEFNIRNKLILHKQTVNITICQMGVITQV
jgi:hypothetical protein